jgi:flagellar motor switch protein FliM
VVADLGTAQVSLGDVMKLKTGDVIPLNIPRTLYATVDNVQVMECHYGVFNGQYALRVVNMINNSQQDGAADSNG